MNKDDRRAGRRRARDNKDDRRAGRRRSEQVAIYRQGRDLSARQIADLVAHVELATDDILLRRAANSAYAAWMTGRDMVTEAELLIEMVAAHVGVQKANLDGPTQP